MSCLSDSLCSLYPCADISFLTKPSALLDFISSLWQRQTFSSLLSSGYWTGQLVLPIGRQGLLSRFEKAGLRDSVTGWATRLGWPAGGLCIQVGLLRGLPDPAGLLTEFSRTVGTTSWALQSPLGRWGLTFYLPIRRCPWLCPQIGQGPRLGFTIV